MVARAMASLKSSAASLAWSSTRVMTSLPNSVMFPTTPSGWFTGLPSRFTDA